MRLGILGVGYVGLVTGVCLSDFGHNVICIDKNKTKINKLQNGLVPIFEPGLEALINKNVKSGRLLFGTDLKKFIDNIDVIFVAVDTPSRRGDGVADLGSLLEAITEISKISNNCKLVVIKSTVPVGTNKKVKDYIYKISKKIEFEIVSNPEFLREGSAIDDFMRPDRVVVGTNSKNARRLMKEIYKPLYLRDTPIMFTDPESAELIKYASNAFLATKISFINEVARLCENTGADVREVARGMGMDERIGSRFLQAGPGYGGSCFPKDTVAFINSGIEFNARQRIVETVVEVNIEVKNWMIKKIIRILGGNSKNDVVCFFGVTFKPNTDDMREAPSLTIIPKVEKLVKEIRVVDPKGKSEGEALLKSVVWCDDPYRAAKGADLIVILTEWNEFRALDLQNLSKVMRKARMADFRNIYSRDEVLENGFNLYEGVGRHKIS